MTWSRREVLASLGVVSAQAALWACGAPAKQVRRRSVDGHPELREWLHDAVATLRGAGLVAPHVLAVSRQRTTAAIDVLGAGVARSRCDGLVITVRDRDGMMREQVTNDLSRDGIAAAAKLLAGGAKPAAVTFGRTPAGFATPNPDPDLLSDGQILQRVAVLAARDRELSSRIVYSAALLDIDDARVWSVAPGRDQQQRLVRVRKSITRVAWNGTRPIVSEAARAWSGGIDDQDLDDDELVAAREGALALMTPSAFEDRQYAFALDPAVAASVIDAAVQALFTSSAARRPEVATRLGIGAKALSPIITLVDDPSVAGAYGGFQFDDAGEPGKPVTLIDRGQVAARLDRARRPGHVGLVQPIASHLRVAAGTTEQDQLLEDGFTLEGPLGAVVDPTSDRIVISVARARERVAGKRSGRMFAEIELVGELSKLMGSVTAVSKQTKTIGLRDEHDGQPRWRSIESPWLRGTGV
ncbi:MAG TPA: metallopeptidase TldD-related protein, partial [Kofleriaceae bacterium]